MGLVSGLPDFSGSPHLEYRPRDDELPDPGEIVWTWVPFEDDPQQGKDRPVLVIGRHEGNLLALMLSSQDHDLDAAEESRWGRYWVDIGGGAWDGEHRPSEARVDRILQIHPADVRREGATLDKERFDEVAAGIRLHAGG
jgi:mRNA-degrading endonuclease toxin of MazEF toxin-antitoxin module